MMVIHFPSALFVMDLMLNAVAFFGNQHELFNAAYYCLMGGVIGGWLAVLTGIVDLFSFVLKKAGDDFPRPAIIHASIQIVMVLGFTFLLSAAYNNPVLVSSPATWMWITRIILVVLLSVGNYYGGELVLKYVSKKFLGNQ